MFQTPSADRSRFILPDLDLLARESQLITRKSHKFSAAGFLQALLSSTASGLASLNQIAGELRARNPLGMARQSLHQRFDIRSTAFLMAVLFDLLNQRYSPAIAAISGSGIQRILIEDSSHLLLPKANAAAFPAHGNHLGATAGIKIDFGFDLLSNTVISHSLHAATEQDQTIGKEFIIHVRCGDLILRDMGFFSLSEFTAIEMLGAWWLTRLPLSTGVVLENSASLEHHLKRCQHDRIDLNIIAGAQGKTCRLVAIRAATEITEKRRAQRYQKARKSNKTACPKGLVRDGWHLMLTNLTQEQASVTQLAAIYRARWAVEIQFRAWKQALNLGKALNRKSNEHHLQAIVIAGMIAHQLGMKLAQQIGSQFGQAKLSDEKLYDLLAIWLIKAHNLAEVAAFNPDLRHIMRDPRTRKSPIESGILALT